MPKNQDQLHSSNPGSPLFQLGFRPFFLLAGLCAVFLVIYWILVYAGLVTITSHLPPAKWHAHEMLFGYTVAVVAGFILTAVRNWTGMATASGAQLIMLCVVWIAGRLLPFIPTLPWQAAALADLAFLPLLALSLVKPLWRGENRVNRVFIILLLLMTTANTIFHGELLGLDGDAGRGQTLMLDTVTLLILMISGRVMPFFTNMAIPGTQAVQRLWVERLSIGLMIALLLAHQLIAIGWLIALISFMLAVLQSIRVSGWYRHAIWNSPVLWVLYTGYGWMILTFLLHALSVLGALHQSLAIHAFTLGVIGVFTLGMMARVSLGHTGRPMKTNKVVNWAFVVINLATVIRVIAPMLYPELYLYWIKLSGALWILAFGMFLMIYTPILLAARIDGKQG